MTLFNWGESPVGKWKLVIEARNKDEKTRNTGRLEHFSLIFYGTKNSKQSLKKRYADHNSRAFVPTSEEIKKIYDIELKLKGQTNIVDKRIFEENPELKDVFRNLNEREED